MHIIPLVRYEQVPDLRQHLLLSVCLSLCVSVCVSMCMCMHVVCMHVRWYSYFEGSMHLHLLPILGMGGRGPLDKRASPFLGKGRHLR